MIIPVAIDPGHPSRTGDTGCVSPDKTLIERDYNMMISRLVASKLQAVSSQLRPVLLREHNDEVVGFDERGRRSADAGAKLVVSIHVNSAIDPRQRGVLGFHWPGNWLGETISNTITEAFPRYLRSKWRSFDATNAPGMEDDWLQSPRNVMIHHQMTSVLIELSYASNENNLKALRDPDVQFAMAMGIVCGIVQLPMYLPGGLYG